MKNDRTNNYRRQNNETKRNQRINNITSPKKENNTQINETPKKNENISGNNNMLENTLKYLEMSNGKNNYFLDNDNNNYIIQGLNEEYDITKKYTESYNTYNTNITPGLNYNNYFSDTNYTKKEKE